MQANFETKLKSFRESAASLTRFQLAIIIGLILLIGAGGAVAYARSRPRKVSIDTAAAGSAQRERNLTVHVAGALQSPGLYELKEGSRVADAVEKAGGAAPDALLDDLNLAGKVEDGQKVMVPRRAAQSSTGTDTVPQEGGSTMINVNTADAAALDKLPGVGPALATRIVEYRRKNGPFSSMEDLDNVEGIGPSKLENLKDMVTF
jgi:competence protein ComEA